MSRKIVVTDYVSLDGVMEDPVGMENSGLGNWTGSFSRGPKGDQFKHQELLAADSLIFGRTTYEAFAAVWPNVKDRYAERMNSLPKYVASSTMKNATWGKSTLWNRDLLSAVKTVKSQGEGETLIYGSASIVHQLAANHLVDEYRLMVYPTILGSGKRLFQDSIRLTMALTECTQFGDGIVLLRYTTS
jgi:dihydrofolate reductase